MSDTINNTSFGPPKSPLFSPKSPIVSPSPIMPSQDAIQYLSYNDKPKASPITYLIETEEEYIDDLRCLLQQVAKSWDRDNPPPPELRVMISGLDEIYNYNKSFYLRLKQIGTELVSAKELGDALMSWVEEMEEPYSTYCQNYRRGVDSWPEIDNNLNLQQTLNVISAQRNKPVTLDFLFEVPLKRIHYYKKLYMRILKSSEPGRPDYDILTAANKRIDSLIELERIAKKTNKPREIIPQTTLHTIISPVSSSFSEIINPQTVINLTLPELEIKLDTSRAVDLFSKKPKMLNIQLLPTYLPFNREIILHNDFIVILPDGEGHRAHVNAHLVLCTDLLLICQQLTPEEKVLNPTKEFWLLYPPLSGRHLALSDMRDNKEDLLNLVVLQKESIVLRVENKSMKESWYKEFTRMIEFAKAATARPQINNINTNISPTLSPQNSTLTQGLSPAVSPSSGYFPASSPSSGYFPASPSSGHFPAVNSGRTLSPPATWSPGRLSPPPGPMKVGLPSSPLSNRAPLSRSRSPDPDQTKNASTPNSGDYSQTGGNVQLTIPTISPIQRPVSPIQRSGSPIQRYGSPIQQYGSPIQRSGPPTQRSGSLDSVSSNASFTETIYKTPSCEISYWSLGEWIPMDKVNYIVEIRITSSNKPCWIILIESTGRIILNAWIYPTTSLHRESPNSMSVACETGQNTEFYKITLTNPIDSDKLFSNFVKMKNHRNNNELGVPSVQGFMSRSSSLKNNEVQQMREIDQVMTEVMEAKVKLFLQSDHGVWTNLGWGNMKILLETPSHRKRIIIQSDKQKSKLVDSFICETGVGKLNKCNVTFKINNIRTSAPIIYMMQMKDDANATKAIEIMKTEKKS